MRAIVLSRSRLDQVVTGVFLAALVVRVAFVLIQTRFLVFDLPFVAGDSLLYLELARNINAGDGMRTAAGPTAYVGPVYPLFLALLTSLGLDVHGIGLVQAILGSVTAALVALCAAELALASGRPDRAAPHAGIAGGATAVYPHIVAWTGYVLTETLFLALVAAAVFFALRAARAAALPLAAGAGLFAGAAALTRSAYLAAALVTFTWLALSARTRRLQLAALFAVSLALPVAGWTARNVADIGAPIVTSTSGGGSMYHGNARGGTGGTRGYADDVDIPELVPPSGLDEVGRDRFYMRAALADISSDALGTIAKCRRSCGTCGGPRTKAPRSATE